MLKNILYIILIVAFNGFSPEISAQNNFNTEELQNQKKTAIENEQYRLAKIIQDEIDKRNSPLYNSNPEWKKHPEKDSVINLLELEKAEAIKNEQWKVAAYYKTEIDSVKNSVNKPQIIPNNTNKREYALMQISKNKSIAQKYNKSTIDNKSTIENVSIQQKIKDSEDNSNTNSRYRRSSLYTLMINDPNRMHEKVIKDAFGNYPLPEKFNDHNIGPYLIQSSGVIKDRSNEIANYLNNNNVAKELVSKWFNRKNTGAFDMELVASRGEYDASTYDKLIAQSSIRGSAILTDAGEELIGNTFVVVNDYKFTNKEEVANQTKGILSGVSTLSSLAGYDISLATDVTKVGVTIAGKGYIIKTTSYLFRLEWDETIANDFYSRYWTDDSKIDIEKIKEFDNSTLFKLRYIGSQDAWADVQSSIFTNKSEEDLIRIATIRATDQAIAKLQRKFEEFRTKTPLFSTDPLTAKIGTKEGLEAGDKFEVLESLVDANNKISYKRKGVIYVKKGMIWDNSYVPEEEIKNIPKQEIEATHFKNSNSDYYKGMLIRQIN